MTRLQLNTRRVPCALCGAEATAPVCENDALQVARCAACGLVFVNPQPTEAALREYHAAQSLLQQVSWSSYFQHTPQQIRELWEERFADLRRWSNGGVPRLLDVGCGYGDFLHIALESGWRVEGFEFSPAVAEVCRSRYGIRVAVGDLLELDFPERSFELITMWHVLEHLHHPLAALRRCRALLAPGGILALEVPNLNFLVRKSYRYPLSRTLHLYHFSPVTLAALVRAAGLEVLECRPGNTGFQYRSRWKIFAKKCLYGFSRAVEKLSRRNVSDSIRLFARRNDAAAGA
jgi:SAM-dependent methyltransferase